MDVGRFNVLVAKILDFVILPLLLKRILAAAMICPVTSPLAFSFTCR